MISKPKRNDYPFYAYSFIFYWFLVVMIFMLLFFQQSTSLELSVNTSYGVINGFTHQSSRTGKPGEIFLGIKYAVADRFQKPKPITFYSNPLDATKFGPICSQPDGDVKAKAMGTTMSEDCLSLNIYAPPRGYGLSPVMVFIHGGSLRNGEGNYNPDVAIEHFTSRGVLLVTLQYRLGFLGFFSIKQLLSEQLANKTSFESNAGLADQILALKWIKKNINSFGGDPGNITLFGQSAGACSVGVLNMVNTKEIEDLFHRVILMSGTSEVCFDGTFGYRDLPGKLAKQFCQTDIHSAGLDEKKLAELQECMQKIDANAVFEHFEKSDSVGWYFVLDDWLLTDIPEKMIDKKTTKKDMIIGITRDEWASLELKFIGSGVKKLDAESYSQKGVLKSIVMTIAFAFPNSSLMKPIMNDLIRSYNLSEVNSTEITSWLQVNNDIMTDASFANRAIREACRYFLLGNKVYLYEFTQPGLTFKMGDYAPAKHADDVAYLFELNGFKGPVGSIMARVWTDFAQGLAPYPEPLDMARWNYFEINNDGIKGRENFRPKARSLWANTDSRIYMEVPRPAAKKAWLTPSKTIF